MFVIENVYNRESLLYQIKKKQRDNFILIGTNE